MTSTKCAGKITKGRKSVKKKMERATNKHRNKISVIHIEREEEKMIWPKSTHTHRKRKSSLYSEVKMCEPSSVRHAQNIEKLRVLVSRT